jgi:uncharacterized membrane protein
MAKDLSDQVRGALQQVVTDAVKSIGDADKAAKNGGLSGMRGMAAGAGLAALAPLAKKGFDAVRSNGGPSLPTPKPGKAAAKVASKAGDKVGGKLKEGVGEKVDEAGGAGGLAKKAAGGLLPGGDSDGEGKSGMPGVGEGRRMPVQQSVDVAVPVETAYNQWTQFEDWPKFMHRVTGVSQEDDCTVTFSTKIWGKTKEFTAEIETQRPDERIKWSVSEGISHTGVVTFHELSDRLTRIELSVDVAPDSLLEKAARGMRAIKRAMRADLHRFKAFIEVEELETGAWRGVIEDGEVVEEHDDSYDEERDYSDRGELFDDEDEDQEDEEEEETRPSKAASSRKRSTSQAQRAKSRSGSSRRGSSSSGTKSKSGSSRSSSSRRGSGSGTKSKAKAGSSSRQSRSRGSSNGSKASSSGSSKRTKSSSGSSSGSSKRKSSSRS